MLCLLLETTDRARNGGFRLVAIYPCLDMINTDITQVKYTNNNMKRKKISTIEQSTLDITGAIKLLKQLSNKFQYYGLGK